MGTPYSSRWNGAAKSGVGSDTRFITCSVRVPWVTIFPVKEDMQSGDENGPQFLARQEIYYAAMHHSRNDSGQVTSTGKLHPQVTSAIDNLQLSGGPFGPVITRV